MASMESELNLVVGKSYTVLTTSEKLYDCVYTDLIHGSWDAPFAIKFRRSGITTIVPWANISAFWQAD